MSPQGGERAGCVGSDGLEGRLTPGEEAPKEGRGRPGGERAARDGLRDRLRAGEGEAGGGGVAVPVIGVRAGEAGNGGVMPVTGEEVGAAKTRPGGAMRGGGWIGTVVGNGTGPSSQKYL